VGPETSAGARLSGETSAGARLLPHTKVVGGYRAHGKARIDMRSAAQIRAMLERADTAVLHAQGAARIARERAAAANRDLTRAAKAVDDARTARRVLYGRLHHQEGIPISVLMQVTGLSRTSVQRLVAGSGQKNPRYRKRVTKKPGKDTKLYRRGRAIQHEKSRDFIRGEGCEAE
jgi:hypothetical protein